MKEVISDSWTDTLEELVKYKEIRTNAGEYDDPVEIEEVLKWWWDGEDYRAYNHLRIKAEKDIHKSSRNNPWYILRLVPKTMSNKEAKNLLEAEY